MLAAVMELIRAVANRRLVAALPIAAGCVLPALVMTGLIVWLAPYRPPVAVQILLVLALITPMGFPLYRLAIQPLADRSALVLLFAAVAIHFCLTGFGQIAFGSESFRTPPFLPGRLDVHVTRLSYQFLLILGVSLGLTLALWLFTQYTLWGKALRATAIDRFGARLVGIRTEAAGALTLVLASGIGALSGVLIGPVTALYYDSGFAMGVKGFVATVIGGMVSFPLSLLGAVVVGLIETFASFYFSAFKEVIVFATLIPFLLWRSAVSRIPDEPEL
jgi:branched-chain amino acid transport system permease protein